MERKVDNLQELTHQESGIIIYGDKVIVVNWNSLDGLPRPSLLGYPMNGPAGNLKVTEEYEVDDIRTVLPVSLTVKDVYGETVVEYDDGDVLYDYNQDIPALWGYEVLCDGSGATVRKDDDGNLVPTAGRVYHVSDAISDAIVIAPLDWN